MKAYLIYFSPGGTTKKTVQNISKGLRDMEVIEIDMLRKENREKNYHFNANDLVIIGMPTATKLFGMPKEIIEKLKGNNTPFVGAVTCGNGYYGKGLIVLKQGMEKQGFKMVAGGGFVGQYTFSEKVATGRPDAKDESIQKKLGEDVYKKVYVKKDISFNQTLKIDWPKEGTFSTLKCAIISSMPGLGQGMPKSWNELTISDKCIQCKKCERHCPVEAITVTDKVNIDRDKCIGCFGCANICPKKAINTANETMIKMCNNVMKYRSDRKEPDVFI